MLVYLFFIFSCGWCVCWLLFLNYQQHTLDSARLARVRRAKRERLRRLRGERRTRLDGAGAESVTVESVVGEDGEHVLLAHNCGPPGAEEGACYCYEESDFDEQLQDADGNEGFSEIFALEGGQHGLFSAQPNGTSECGNSLVGLESGWREMRGWPEELEERRGPFGEEGEEPKVCELPPWPMVGLHENPLNSASLDAELADGAAKRRLAELGSGERDCDRTLNRSRILSLREDQERNRAAIRLVSRVLV